MRIREMKTKEQGTDDECDKIVWSIFFVAPSVLCSPSEWAITVGPKLHVSSLSTTLDCCTLHPVCAR